MINHNWATKGQKRGDFHLVREMSGMEVIFMADSPDKWLTLSEASNIIGKSTDSLRKMIKRGKLSRVKKIPGERGKQWVIHRDEVEGWTRPDKTHVQGGQTDQTNTGQINVISVEHYDKQREKWEEEKSGLVQGMLMYRWKFEELDRKLKLFPAPVEVVALEFDKVKSDLHEKEVELEIGRAHV